jgi:hypothetical protein
VVVQVVVLVDTAVVVAVLAITAAVVGAFKHLGPLAAAAGDPVM